MLTDDELWEKCKRKVSITPEDLGTPVGAINHPLVIDCGSKYFYTDGIEIVNPDGTKVDEKTLKKYRLI